MSNFPYTLICVMEVPTSGIPSYFPATVSICIGCFVTQRDALEAFNQHPYADHPALISAGCHQSFVDASRDVGGDK